MSPLLSISVAPNALNSAPCVSVASVLPPPPMPRPNVRPSFCADSAYLVNASQVQLSDRAVCSGFTGFIACTSRPCCLNQPMRAHGGLVCVPDVVGTATQWPFAFARYSQMGSTAPFLAISRPMTSSIGSSESATLNTSQLKNASASCPVFACASAAPVSCSLLPEL